MRVVASCALAVFQDEEPAWADLPAPRKLLEGEAAAPRPGFGAGEDPSPAGIAGWTFVVLALLVGCFVAARRFLGRSPLLAGGGLIQVVSRRALGPRQELYLVEVGPRAFLIGTTRERIVALGEFERGAEPRAAAEGADASADEFRARLRGRLAPEARPAGEAAGSYAQITQELENIRKTVDRWRA